MHSERFARILCVFEQLAHQPRLQVIQTGATGRKELTFPALYREVIAHSKRLATLKRAFGLRRLAICAASDLDWLILDLACLRSGIQTIAVPENLPLAQARELMESLPADVVVHSGGASDPPYVSQFAGLVFCFSDSHPHHTPFRQVPMDEQDLVEEIADGTYSFGFTSGTQREEKILSLPYFRPEERGAKTPSGPPHRMMLWTPFTHFIQRVLAFRALSLGRTLILSSPERVALDVIAERPTHMICAPFYYESLARTVTRQLAGKGRISRAAIALYGLLRVNRCSPDSPIRRAIDARVLGPLAAAYGGRPVEFKWNGGPIGRAALEILDSVGLQVYGTYGISEVGPIASDKRSSYRLGSVGRPLRALKLSEEGQILVKVDADIRDRSRLRVDDDGYIHTGDFGHFEGPNLFIDGRMDDTLVLKSGKKVRPQRIETQVCSIDGVHRACAFTSDSLRIRVLIVREGRHYDEPFFGRALQEVNRGLEAHERVQEFSLVDLADFQGASLTHTLKTRRRALIAWAAASLVHRTATYAAA